MNTVEDKEGAKLLAALRPGVQADQAVRLHSFPSLSARSSSVQGSGRLSSLTSQYQSHLSSLSLLCLTLSSRTHRATQADQDSTKRSHFIFEKGSGKLVDIALGVKPADE